MVVSILRGLLIVFGGVYAIIFGRDYSIAAKAKKLEEDISVVKSAIIGFITNLFDTLGIGSFATSIALFKALKLNIPDKNIPGTLNVCHTIPIITQALIYTTVVKVDPLTLIVLIAAAVVGSYLGAGIISKMDEKKVQIIVGIALAVAAVIMFLSHPWIDKMPGGGTATGLTGAKLLIGAVGNFILGALMTAGIGLYGPCMAMVYFLGMSPTVAYPIMMGSCALLMPVSSAKFIKEGAYCKKVSLPIAISGIFGVIVAVKFFTGLPMDYLKLVVIVVIAYTSATMLRSALKRKS
ncbi:sulfite exporter TauE/SafE family protein [Metaclostridioides mangenotii]|uniref:Probable membrane transporter protein n=1 Tax=Metaclostridioides mangenotii TaxID=1540 RepID=A0ABS4EAM7_9FIRM|nr:sulfite exporter TauE/SafE family protein [Clostridioides mangenotii]MBP1854996.1 putative membrane protein YfcA [Clostridioides mangenotii]